MPHRLQINDWKTEIFKNENPQGEFPAFTELTPSECDLILRKVNTEFLGLNELPLIKVHLKREIRNRSTWVGGINAKADNFGLDHVVDMLNIKASTFVYINWCWFDDMNSIAYNDLVKYFDYIWYPGPDDIEIFDDSFEWMISISHSGDIYFLCRHSRESGNPERDAVTLQR